MFYYLFLGLLALNSAYASNCMLTLKDILEKISYTSLKADYFLSLEETDTFRLEFKTFPIEIQDDLIHTTHRYLSNQYLDYSKIKILYIHRYRVVEFNSYDYRIYGYVNKDTEILYLIYSKKTARIEEADKFIINKRVKRLEGNV